MFRWSKTWELRPGKTNTSVWRTDRQTDGSVKPIAITCFSIADARKNDRYHLSSVVLLEESPWPIYNFVIILGPQIIHKQSPWKCVRTSAIYPLCMILTSINSVTDTVHKATANWRRITYLPILNRPTDVNLSLCQCAYVIFILWQINYQLLSCPVCIYTGGRTRGHSLKLRKPSCHTNVRKYFFSVRVINRWNSLGQEAVESTSINSFKKHLQRAYDTKMGFFMEWRLLPLW